MVVGAGPGGIAAAITALGHGCSVVCVDKATFPRDKTCGDGLTTGALRELEALGLTRAEFVAVGVAPVRETVLVSPSGRRVTLPAARPTTGCTRRSRRAAISTPRSSRSRAARGVDVREQCAVEKVAPRDDEVELLLADGDVAARPPRDRGRRSLVDGAARARTRRAARPRRVARGAPVLRRRRRRPAVGALRARPPARLRVGVPAARRRRQRRLRRAARRRAQRPRPQAALARAARPARRSATSSARRARPTEPVRAWPIPTRYDPARLAQRARAVRRRRGRRRRPDDRRRHRAGARDRRRSRPRRSRRAATRKRSPRATAGRSGARSAATCASRRRCSRCCAHPLGARAAIAAAGLTPWTRRNFARWMFEDYPRALVLTPDRWRRARSRRRARTG